MQFFRKDIDRHKQQECPYRIVKCLLQCGMSLAMNRMEEHIQHECLKQTVQCKNNCGVVVERGNFEHHVQHECQLQQIECPNKGESLFDEGCALKIRRKELESHKVMCNYRRIYCQNQKCNAIIIYKDLGAHDERCLFKVVECVNRCGMKVQRQGLDRHREACQFQLVKCPYYELGCKIEILRKDYKQHLHEEAFNHSILFIEGQKLKNREFDDLKGEIANLRKDYEVEIKTMFMELQRVKEDLQGRAPTRQSLQNQLYHRLPSTQSQDELVLGPQQTVAAKKDERRYDKPAASSNYASSVFEYSSNQPRPPQFNEPSQLEVQR